MSSSIQVQEQRKQEVLRRRVNQLEDDSIAHNQQILQAAMMGYGNPGNNSGGSFYADPGSTTIASGANADLVVVEILGGGNTSLGTRTVINVLPDTTAANKRLLLNKTRDGAYVVYSQACSTND